METAKLSGIRAFVFDAYGTLFDVNSAAESIQDELGPQWSSIADQWRSKQLQYTWLRGLSGNYVDLWQVTGDALTFALRAHNLATPDIHARLMNLYLTLKPYPEVVPTLSGLKQRGLALAILSNGSPRMLSAAVNGAGIATMIDEVISVDRVRTFKPHPSVYQLAPQLLGINANEICFISSNAWDAYSAKAYGFRVLWCNRSKQPAECLPGTPDAEIGSLTEIADYLA